MVNIMKVSNSTHQAGRSPAGCEHVCPCQTACVRCWSPGRGAARVGRSLHKHIPGDLKTVPGEHPYAQYVSNIWKREENKDTHSLLLSKREYIHGSICVHCVTVWSVPFVRHDVHVVLLSSQGGEADAGGLSKCPQGPHDDTSLSLGLTVNKNNLLSVCWVLMPSSSYSVCQHI